MSQLFPSGDQNIGASASALILPISYSGLIFFKIDWFDLLAVQGTLWSLLQHHNLKVSILVLCLLYGPALRTVHDYWKDQVLWLVAQSCPTHCDPNCSPPGSSVHGDSPGRNTGVGDALLQGIFPTQG